MFPVFQRFQLLFFPPLNKTAVRWPGRCLEKLSFWSSSVGLETSPSACPSSLWLGHSVSGSTQFFLTKKGAFLQNPLGSLPENRVLVNESKWALKDTWAINKPLFSSFWQRWAHRNVGGMQLGNEPPSVESRKCCECHMVRSPQTWVQWLTGSVTLGKLICFE